MKHTKGNFKDGYTGWKISERKTNGVDGFEIHWSEDGECVTDHVYTLEDAKLIAAAPELLELLMETTTVLSPEFKSLSDRIESAIKKATK